MVLDPEQKLADLRAQEAHPEEEALGLVRLRDGRVFERYSRPWQVGDAVVGRVVSFRDVTTRERAVQALRESQRKLRLLSRDLLRIQEEERTRIARELHDQIGQALTAVKLNLQTQNGASRAKALTEGVAAVDRALEQVRTLSFDLRPAMLDDLGLAAALRSYAKRSAAAAGLRLHVAIDAHKRHAPAQVQSTCFRIAQEAITNVVRHARARHLNVCLSENDHSLELLVQDDGVGFVRTEGGRGREAAALGVLGMRERAEAMHGTLEVDSEPGRGTVVRAQLPLEAPPSGWAS